ncbi:MAG TPA: hypothetical protein VE404_00700 [Verrucomicrobiae bacterium]|nr:hypothetical protein [Verrucomicrobiae bacterium]
MPTAHWKAPPKSGLSTMGPMTRNFAAAGLLGGDEAAPLLRVGDEELVGGEAAERQTGAAVPRLPHPRSGSVPGLDDASFRRA